MVAQALLVAVLVKVMTEMPHLYLVQILQMLQLLAVELVVVIRQVKEQDKKVVLEAEVLVTLVLQVVLEQQMKDMMVVMVALLIGVAEVEVLPKLAKMELIMMLVTVVMVFLQV
jgi:hypothetical protein|tara:strand:- start:189 stop:530 length:342 start_codon:yes stop_codon:yes gene_type:complete